ncbi:MAG: VWA domain-containing protein [Crocinitomicaceae bacterium]|nr:VWA domain-containing protein [Crocinitomicaceae bacterium]
MKLHYDFPGFVFLIIAAFALLVAWFLYRKDHNFGREKWGLIALRSISLFLIILLLLDIFLESKKDVEMKPVIIVGFDNSESVFLKDSARIDQITSDWQNLVDQLKQNYDVVSLKIGDNTVENEELNFTDKKSNISNFFEEIKDRYYNSNIGAIILATDGIFNDGMNPVYTSEKLNYTPIFTVGLGDTTPIKDLKIINIFHNDIAFLKNKFPLELDLNAEGLKGQSTRLQILRDEKEVYKEDLDIETESFNQTKKILLDAEKVGINKYTVSLSEVAGEEISTNNSRTFYINVIDSRQKVLILANAPHPDVGAIKFAVENNSDMEVSSSNIADFKGKIKDYDVIVLHNLPSSKFGVPEEINNSKKPLLIVVGGQTDLNKLNRMNLGFTYSGNWNTDAVSPSINQSFSAFKLDDRFNKVFKSSPPVFSRFAKVKFNGANSVFLYQKIGSIVKDEPLVFFNELNGIKKAVINADGIWKWRLNDYNENETTENFDNLIDKFIQYVAVKEDKSNFRIKTKAIYNENEDVVVSAELYNDAFELVNTSTVDFVLKNEAGELFNYSLLPYEDIYKLSLGKLKKGLYTYTAKTELNGKSYTKTGQFLVKEILLEYINLQADHGILKTISKNSEGQFIGKNEMNTLADLIQTDKQIGSVVYQEKNYKDIIDYKWLFVIIALCLAIEWWLRKRLGTY